MEAATALQRLGGIARTAQLRRLGIRPAPLLAAVEAGEVRRVRKGVYALEVNDVSIAAAHGGAVTCISALRAHGLWTPDGSSGLHVEVGINGRAHSHRLCACRTHRTAEQSVFGLMPVEQSLLTAYHCMPMEDLFAAFESALRHRRLTPRACRALIARLPQPARAPLSRVRCNADSGLESIFRFRLMLLGIELESQVEISGIGRVDFRSGSVLFEIDGRLNHIGDMRHKDLIRDAAAARLGYRTLRFDYAMIMHDWPRALQTVRAALAG